MKNAEKIISSSKILPYLMFFFHFGICLPFVLLMWNHGHHPTDDGYILAYSWRIWNGQIPYADFLFDKPPLSPILHTIWFLFGYSHAFNAARIGYYLQMSIISTCWSIWAVKQGWACPSLPTLCIFAIFTLVSLHTFPPMPWYTVDSVMLSSLGILALLFSLKVTTRIHFILLRFASGLLVGSSALCKQNFFVIHAAWILVCILDYLLARRKNNNNPHISLSWCVSFIINSFLPMICILFWIFLHGSSTLGIRNISQLTTTNALLSAGWYDYANAIPKSIYYFLLGIILSVINLWQRRIDWIPIMLIFSGFITIFGRMNNITDGILGGAPVFFWGLGMLIGRLSRFVLRKQLIDWSTLVFCFFAFAIPWSSSISLGWRTPLLGIATLSPFFAATVSTSRPSKLASILAVASIMVLTVVFCQFHIQYAYRDVPRSAQIHNISTLYPKFGSLYVSKHVYSQYAELKQISSFVSASNNSTITILGEHPLFYFLDNRLNPTSLDWYYPPHYIGATDRILHELRQKKPVVVIPVREDSEKCVPSYTVESITNWVQEMGSLLYKTPSFCAYQLN